MDAKNLLEALMNGAAQQNRGGLGGMLGQILGGGAPGQPNQPGTPGGGLGDILGQIMAATQGGQAGSPQQPSGGGLGALPGGLGNILGSMIPGGGAGAPAPAAAPAGGAPAAGGGLGGLGDILGKLGQAAQQGAGNAAGAGGSIIDVLGSILGQATQGVQTGARDLDSATGASQRARDAISQATGMNPDEVMAKLRDLMQQNQLGAGAAMGGLGTLVLGTKTGRSMARHAAELGALALIGGLAYQAYRNYSQGAPVPQSAAPSAPAVVPQAAPQGSGFEADALTHDSAALYVKAMIAAAAAGGRIEPDQQQAIMGALGQSGLDDAQHSFLRNELSQPSSADDLAAACQTPEQAVQVYTAARMAAHPDNPNEAAFLADLAQKLGVDDQLAAHVDAAARASTH